jgi:hypothetical protein
VYALAVGSKLSITLVALPGIEPGFEDLESSVHR